MNIFRFLSAFLTTTLFVMTLSNPAVAGKPISDFTLQDINNKEVSLSDFKGKVVLIQFWATWCGPCKIEMQHLNKIYKELGKDGFVILSVSSDDAKTSRQVKPYIRSKGYRFPVVLDTQSAVTLKLNPTKNLPYSILVGKDFTIAKEYNGYSAGDEVKVEQHIREELAK